MRRLLAGFFVLCGLGAAVFWAVTIPRQVDAAALAPREADLANGATMFHAAGCAECHAAPGQSDSNGLGGGLPLKSPFGTFYAPNISPDADDGIGRWTEAAFVTAMSKGTAPDGRHYYPALPYPSYQRMRIEDMRDIFAHIRTLPAVAGRSRDHDLRFPFTIRRALGLWKLLYLDGESFRPDPAQSAAWNRGAYLVNGAAHCGECHTPRNVLGGPIATQRFAGGRSPEGQGWIPNITQKTLHNWSQDDFAEMLASGRTENGESVSGVMAEVVRSTAKLSPQDRAAMAVYLKSLAPVAGPLPPDMP